MIIDLHCHSNISDGVLSPKELVAHAAHRGVQVLALTDHDDVSGLVEARSAALQHDIIFINGVEISVTWKKRTLHIVGLKINPEDVALTHALKNVRNMRETRAIEIANSLEKVGIKNAFLGAKKFANQSIMTRVHFARFLVENGYAKDVKSVFKKYLVKGKPGFVDQQWMSLQEAVQLILDSGGIAVLAHPGRYDLGKENMHLLLNEFRAYGGMAIEVVTGSHRPEQYPHFAKLAHRFSLSASIGSDYHGPNLSYAEMGHLKTLPSGCVPVWQNWEETQHMMAA